MSQISSCISIGFRPPWNIQNDTTLFGQRYNELITSFQQEKVPLKCYTELPTYDNRKE